MNIKISLPNKVNILKFFLVCGSILALLGNIIARIFPAELQDTISFDVVISTLALMGLAVIYTGYLEIKRQYDERNIDKARYKIIEAMIRDLDISLSEYLDSFGKSCNQSLITAARIWVEHKILFPKMKGSEIEEIINKILPKDLKLKTRITPPLIVIDNCFVIADDAKRIRTYLQHVQKAKELILKHEQDIVPSTDTRFLCDIKIRHSYLAPRFLIHGMMAAFDEEWEPVVNRYGIDVAQRKSGRNSDFEAFRVFQFNCWVIWGPSIPICSCKDWNSGRDYTLQLGFGDENNSIDFLYRNDGDTRGIDAEIIKEFSNAPTIAVEVTGSLHDAEDICNNDKSSILGYCPKGVLCDPIFDERDNSNKHRSTPTRLIFKLKDRNSLRNSTLQMQKNYYSSYIWVMFSLPKAPLSPNTRIENANRDSIGDWRDLLPFFIHGNVAENCTIKMYKEMLVDQIIGNAKRILSEYPDINLRYECAFDDSSEGNQLLHIGIAPELTLREILKRVISNDAKMLEFVNNGRFIIPPLSQRYLDNHHDSPYSSCKLPAIIKQYYRETKMIK